MTRGARNRNSVILVCDRHREIQQREGQLHHLLGDVEATLVDRHKWFELTRVQRRTLPAAQLLYKIEDELEQLERESAKLVTDLHSIPSVSMRDSVAKLEVVARVLEPDDYPDAHAVLAAAIEELQAFSKQ